MHLIYIYEKEKKFYPQFTPWHHSDEVWDLSTWNDILFHFWWTGPDHHILFRTPWLMFTRNDYHVYSCSVILIMNHGQRIYSVMIDYVPLWAVCHVSSARSCLYTPQIVAIKSCPSMLLVHPDAEPLYGSTVVAYCRQCLMPVPFFL